MKEKETTSQQSVHRMRVVKRHVLNPLAVLGALCKISKEICENKTRGISSIVYSDWGR